MGVPQKVNKEEARALRQQGWKLSEIARHQGVHHSRISLICRDIVLPKEAKHPTGNLPKARVVRSEMSAERREIARALRLQGMTIMDIVAETGFGRHQVSRYCTGIPVRGRGKGAGNSHRVIPQWVHDAGLVDDFRDVKREFGEEAAASHCRRLKAEAQRWAA